MVKDAQNLATFVTTWMELEAKKLMSECFDKNMIDKDEYPQTAEIESRCINTLTNLWNSQDHEISTGASTIGSSEAAMLGGMALEWFASQSGFKSKKEGTHFHH